MDDRTKSRVAVALTATIEPSSEMPNLMVRDSNVRLAEYSKSIHWWSKLVERHGYELFVFENSGRAEDLSIFESNLVSIIPVPVQGSDDVRRGKGAGESLILSVASRVLIDYSLILKCTGRLQVLNAPNLIARHLSLPGIQAVVSWNMNLSQVDTRCFTVRPEFLGEWMAAIDFQVCDDLGFDLESQSAKWLMSKIFAGSQIVDFSRSPAIVGRSGSEGVTYSKFKAQTRLMIEHIVKGRLRKDPN